MENIQSTKFTNIIEQLETANLEGGLIKILQVVQKEFSHIPLEAIDYISNNFDIPKASIYGVTTFYAQFKLEPVGRNIIKVCRGTACHVSNSERLAIEIREILNLSPDKSTTTDMRFTIEEVACLGCCSLAPAVMINDNVYGQVTKAKIKTILEEYK